MRRIYISGKISGLPIEQATYNFAESAKICEREGKKPINPMTFKHPLRFWIGYMVIDIIMLLTCSEIYLQSDWFESKGARIECKVAKFFRKKLIVKTYSHGKI